MKNKRLPLILLGVLLALVALYFALVTMNNRRSEQEELDAQNASIVICEFEEPELVSYTGPNGSLSFTKTDGVWKVDGDPDFPLQSSAIELLCTTVDGLTAVRQLEGGEDISSYGFDEPVYTVTLTDAAGDELTLLIGNAASNGDYYAMRDDGEAVYTISSSLPQLLYKGLLDLYELPAIPLSGGTVDTLSYTSTLEELQPSYSVEGLADDDTADSDAIISLRSAWSAMAFSSCYAYQPDADTVSQCGLDAPSLSLSIRYAEGSGTEIELGAQTDTGGYYARLSGNNDIFILSAQTADDLISALADIGGDGE